MKRFIAMFLLLCMVLAAMPATADSGYIGNMEVVNCSEWVSLREAPGTSAKRLVKVSLGAIVSNCRQVNDAWIYAEYDGYSGYILAEYLEPSDGRITFSAMMVTILDGAPFYATIDSTVPIDCIPANTIVRNCHVTDYDRVYVEWGSRCGFISLLHAEVYNEMLHFPQQITLHCNPFDAAYEGSEPVLRIDYTVDFPLAQYDYSQYDFAEFGLPEGIDADTPAVEFVLHSDMTLNHVHLFNVCPVSWDDETGDTVYDATLEHIQYQVDPEHPLSVKTVIWGDTPNLAVGYADEDGTYHFVFVEISGEDGSLLLREF
ncbi:MAG: SH3 domain-containing protein [Clostridia bacterium]|nr:SH3 domain-containing protein [Clostridia bacterium]